MARHVLKDLGRDRLTAELLQPNELASGMLLQVLVLVLGECTKIPAAYCWHLPMGGGMGGGRGQRNCVMHSAPKMCIRSTRASLSVIYCVA